MGGATTGPEDAAPAPADRSRVLVPVLCTAALAWSVGQTTIIPAFPAMQEAFDTDPSGVAWTLTGYLLVAAVLTPVLGRVGDVLGHRRVLLVVLALLAVGNAVSALGTSLPVVVGGRVLQGAGGAIFPLCFSILRRDLHPDRVSRGIGTISALVGVGGGAGLVLGGFLVDHDLVPWIFWSAAIVAAVSLVAVAAVVAKDVRTQRGHVDVRGAAVLGVGLVLPLLAISRANLWGWTDPRTLGLVVVGGLVLCGWVVLQRRTVQPLADLAMLRSRPVLLINAATLLAGFGIFGSFVLIPGIVQVPSSTGWGLGLDATHAGLVMLPGAVLMMFLGPVSGTFGARFGNRLSMAIGCAVAGTGLVLIGLRHGDVAEVVCWSAMLYAGMAFCFAAMPNLIVDVVPSSQTGEATGFNGLVRTGGASIGAQLCAAILAGGAVRGTVGEDAFVVAFVLSGGVAILGALLACAIPRPPAAAPIGALRATG